MGARHRAVHARAREPGVRVQRRVRPERRRAGHRSPRGGVRVRGLDIQPVPRASPRRRLLRRSTRRFPLLAERDVDGVGAAREERAGG